MTDIFVSYQREDYEVANNIVTALKVQNSGSGNLTIWWDKALRAGEDFTPAIYGQLKAARCVLVLWSQHSVRSDWVVRREALDALCRGVLIPVLLDDAVRLPLIFTTIHHVSLATWKGDSGDPAFKSLLSGIENKLTTPPRRAGFLPRFLFGVAVSTHAVQAFFHGLNVILDFIAVMIRGKEKLLWLRAALSFLGVLVLSVLVGMLAAFIPGKLDPLFFAFPTLLLGIILTFKVAWRRRPK